MGFSIINVGRIAAESGVATTGFAVPREGEADSSLISLGWFLTFPLTAPFPSRPYVDLVNILLTCGEEVKKAITRSVQAQCEQNWGSLCSILSFCTSAVHGDAEKKVGEGSRASGGRGDMVAHADPEHRESSRAAKGERGTKGHSNTRAKAGGHSPKGAHGILDRAEELSDFSDVRR